MKIMAHKRVEIRDEIDSYHIRADRAERMAVVERLLEKENAELVKTLWVDKGHANGAELHNVYSNGVVKIYNAKTLKHITDLIGVEYQIERYYKAVGKQAPKRMINLARKHRLEGLCK